MHTDETTIHHLHPERLDNRGRASRPRWVLATHTQSPARGTMEMRVGRSAQADWGTRRSTQKISGVHGVTRNCADLLTPQLSRRTEIPTQLRKTSRQHLIAGSEDRIRRGYIGGNLYCPWAVFLRFGQIKSELLAAVSFFVSVHSDPRPDRRWRRRRGPGTWCTTCMLFPSCKNALRFE